MGGSSTSSANGINDTALNNHHDVNIAATDMTVIDASFVGGGGGFNNNNNDYCSFLAPSQVVEYVDPHKESKLNQLLISGGKSKTKKSSARTKKLENKEDVGTSSTPNKARNGSRNSAEKSADSSPSAVVVGSEKRRSSRRLS